MGGSERAEAAKKELLTQWKKGAPNWMVPPGKAVYVQDVTSMTEAERQDIVAWFETNEGPQLEKEGGVKIDEREGRTYLEITPVMPR